MTLDEKIDSIQERFDVLDALRNRIAAGQNFELWSDVDRTLYFVHDVCGITSNAGLSTWVFYHGQSEDQSEVIAATAAFRRLHLDHVADALDALLAVYREHGGCFPERFDGRSYSATVWDYTDAIYNALYGYIHSMPKA